MIAAFESLVAIWVVACLYVILNRFVHERRTRAVAEVARELAREATPDSRGTLAAIQRIVSRRSRRAVYRMVANTALPPRVTELCARYSLERWGVARMQRDALPNEGPKWRRISALFALGAIRAPNAHALLARALADRDADVAGAALVALHRLGDRAAAEILVTALAERAYAPSRIASQLDQFPIPIADLLLPMLSDDRPEARYWAASLLRRYTGTAGVGAAIAALASDHHPPVRRAVLGTLGALGAEEAADVAERLLGDPVGYVRAHAARLYATARRREVDEATVRAIARRLVTHLGDAEWDVRLAVKESLVLLGPGCWRDVAVLLESPDRFARNGAAEVLQNLGLVDVLVRDIGSGASVDAELVGVLERAFLAGGPGMVDAAAARSPGGGSGSAAALLVRLGFVGGGEGRTA